MGVCRRCAMTVTSLPSDKPRRLSAWLLAGLIASPVLFLGFLFRGGYSTDLRIAAGTYAIVMTAAGMVRMAAIG